MTTSDITSFFRKHPLGIGCGLVALLCAGAAYVRSSEIPELNTQLEEKLKESARIAANVNNATRLTAQLAELTEASKEINSRLVQGSELANNLQYFYRLEAEAGIKLLDLRQNPRSTKASAPKTTFSGVTFVASLHGEYPAVLDLLRRLENGVHYSRIVSASIRSSGADRNSPLQVALSVELLGRQ